MYKLNEDVLLEIIDIVRVGISEGKDISDMLRDIELDIPTQIDDMSPRRIVLSKQYKLSHRRA